MNLVYALTANGRSFAENAGEAGKVTLLGMGAIFAVLALMWLVIEISHRLIVGPAPKAEKKPEKPVKKTEKKPEKKTPAAPAPVAAPAGDNGALIAAITAAISAAMAEEGYTGGFRVVSFKRASDRRVGRR